METRVDNNKANDELKRPKFPWLVLAGVIALWFINLGFGVWAMGFDASKGGQWGDIFGAVNALFSAGSVLLIYHGIRMQRYEVDLAKAELAESKKQTLAQKIALDKQNEATERQMFENTFFKLLDDYNEIVLSLKCTNINSLFNERFDFNDTSEHATIIEGKSVFDEISNLIDLVFDADLDNYSELLASKYPSPIRSALEFDEKYEVINSALNGLLDRYFRTVYNILKFITAAKFSAKNKKFYSNILRAQMTNKETKVLAFNIASKNGRDKFLNLAENLNFLKHCYNVEGEISLLCKVIKAKAFK